MKAALVTLEGIDGSGKSTQVTLLREYLDEMGCRYVYLREPGGTHLGEEIRRVLLNPEFKEMGAEVEALLYAASRAQLVRQAILPALAAGEAVVCDRFVDSSLAYQGYGGGLPVDAVREINRIATSDLRPDLTLLFDLPLEQAFARWEHPPDRMEQKAEAFHRRVREGYLQLASAEPDRIKLIDAGKPIPDVQREVRRHVARALGLGG